MRWYDNKLSKLRNFSIALLYTKSFLYALGGARITEFKIGGILPIPIAMDFAMPIIDKLSNDGPAFDIIEEAIVTSMQTIIAYQLVGNDNTAGIKFTANALAHAFTVAVIELLRHLSHENQPERRVSP